MREDTAEADAQRAQARQRQRGYRQRRDQGRPERNAPRKHFCLICGTLRPENWQFRGWVARKDGARCPKHTKTPQSSTTKVCNGCLQVLPIARFPQQKGTTIGKASKCQHCLKLWHCYRMTRAEYDALLMEQDGVCAICREPGKTKKDQELLCVDHGHRPGRIRGLLCASCNSALGLFRDDPAIVAHACQYLQATTAEPVSGPFWAERPLMSQST
jgi:hypothetical protein